MTDLFTPKKAHAIQECVGQNQGHWLDASWIPQQTLLGTEIRQTYSLEPHLFTKEERDSIISKILERHRVKEYKLEPIQNKTA